MWNLKDNKDPGESFSSLAPLLLAAVFTTILVILFSGWMSNFDKKNSFDEITRKYILKMETTGGLTPEDETKLLKELEPLATNIKLEVDGKKTTKAGEVEYGDDIDLYITADLYTYKMNILGSKDNPSEPGTVWQLVNEDGDIETDNGLTSVSSTSHTTTITKHRSSTSKH